MKLDPSKEIPSPSDSSGREAGPTDSAPAGDEPNRFQRQYSETSFWEKLGRHARIAGRDVVEKALILFFTAQSPRTPRWARTTIFGALGYFIVPLDAIPDLTPVVGYSDDLGVLVAAIAVVLAHVTPETRMKAAAQAEKWFGSH